VKEIIIYLQIIPKENNMTIIENIGEYKISIGNPDMKHVAIFDQEERSLFVCDYDNWLRIKNIIDDMFQMANKRDW
jgi:hypothetical protein